MINSLYQLTRKGWLQALSFILSVAMFAMILLYSNTFALYFGGKIPYLVAGVFYGMLILFVHGFGFEIKSTRWQVVFMPLLGYIIILPSLIALVVLH
ncbi:cyd operon YbgE family protein [Glaesserella parasuis]|uniref:cyd operon YbgE family protein n=1 Tax=Glaesserella parasuis TaxID=738 RepID=UPI0013665360|nr:cyd operon YbgE family protein [Glaesserella parasuis]MDG6241153.1 cyd operon YbgE family protein [Glaesserella parasuis]MDG6294119.1 cyd operon YbgE family protein [Glaesserella parasuis]MDG6790714.1 cyd operon YbgE family protein [Glaesserella parasuis]MDG6792724.1 cyd operon YbgE family protein [Glaesserella parasuis]MDG6853467.1 cyd operon YbgE family protein [Glaesserella parasuis]